MLQFPTRFTSRVGVRYPIIQAPMAGGATTPELVAAVSNAGALGSFGAAVSAPAAIRDGIARIRALTDKYVMGTYLRTPLALARGEGTHVYDPEGNAYLDFVSGLAVTSLGHVAAKPVAALKRQADTLWHVSNLFYTEPQARLAQLLVENGIPGGRCFFGNSGAEANEAALKLARKRSNDLHGPGRTEVLATELSFHGRTLATLSATGQEKVHNEKHAP